MQIHVIAVLVITFLSHNSLVLGSESCVEKCTDECQATCPEQKVCIADEIDCGPGTPPENPFCEIDRICVAKNCNCKKNDFVIEQWSRMFLMKMYWLLDPFYIDFLDISYSG